MSDIIKEESDVFSHCMNLQRNI